MRRITTAWVALFLTASIAFPQNPPAADEESAKGRPLYTRTGVLYVSITNCDVYLGGNKVGFLEKMAVIDAKPDPKNTLSLLFLVSNDFYKADKGCFRELVPWIDELKAKLDKQQEDVAALTEKDKTMDNDIAEIGAKVRQLEQDIKQMDDQIAATSRDAQSAAANNQIRQRRVKSSLDLTKKQKKLEKLKKQEPKLEKDLSTASNALQKTETLLADLIKLKESFRRNPMPVLHGLP